MKQCPECNRAYSDDTLNFCLDDGAILLACSEPKANSLHLKTTDPIFKFDNVDNAPVALKREQWNPLDLGLTLCLCSIISMVILNEQNTRKLLRENTAHGYEAIMILLIVVFLIGAGKSYANLKQSFNSRA
jgi:hypothetical protein